MINYFKNFFAGNVLGHDAPKEFKLEEFVELCVQGRINAAEKYLTETEETNTQKEAYKQLITEWKKHYGNQRDEQQGQKPKLAPSVYMKFFQLLLKRQQIQAQQFATTEFEDEETKLWLPRIEAFKVKSEGPAEKIIAFVQQMQTRNEQEWFLYSQKFSFADFNEQEKQNLKKLNEWKIEYESIMRYKTDLQRQENKEASLACQLAMRMLSEIQTEKFDLIDTVKDKQAQYYLSKIASHLKNIVLVEEQLRNLVKIINELEAEGGKSSRIEDKANVSISDERNILNSLQNSMISLNNFVTNSQRKIASKTDHTSLNGRYEEINRDLQRKIRQLFGSSGNSFEVIQEVFNQLNDLRSKPATRESFDEQLSRVLCARLKNTNELSSFLTLQDYDRQLKKSIQSDIQTEISRLNNSLGRIYKGANQSFKPFMEKEISSVSELEKLFKKLKESLERPNIKNFKGELENLQKEYMRLKDLYESVKQEKNALFNQKQGYRFRCEKVKTKMNDLKRNFDFKKMRGERQTLTKMVKQFVLVSPSLDLTPLNSILNHSTEKILSQCKTGLRKSISARLATLKQCKTQRNSFSSDLSEQLQAYSSLLKINIASMANDNSPKEPKIRRKCHDIDD